MKKIPSFWGFEGENFGFYFSSSGIRVSLEFFKEKFRVPRLFM